MICSESSERARRCHQDHPFASTPTSLICARCLLHEVNAASSGQHIHHGRRCIEEEALDTMGAQLHQAADLLLGIPTCTKHFLATRVLTGWTANAPSAASNSSSRIRPLQPASPTQAAGSISTESGSSSLDYRTPLNDLLLFTIRLLPFLRAEIYESLRLSSTRSIG